MQLDKNIVDRLILIKYMYEKGVEQSKKSDPGSQVSILMFHDAVELFLILACDYLDIDGKKFKFLEYWSAIKQKSKVQISCKKPMERLNKARNGLKHGAILLHSSTLEEFRVMSRIFFEKNTKKVFKIEFSEISLIDAIQNEHVRKKLKKSELLINNGDLKASINEMAIAFASLIDDHENKAKNALGIHYSFSETPLSLDTSLSSYGLDDDYFIDAISSNFDDLEYSINGLQETVKLISWGINYYEYMKFQSITPYIRRIPNKITGEIKYNILELRQKPLFGKIQENEITYKQANFCLDFIINTAMILQEFG